MDDNFYEKCLSELRTLIPKEEFKRIMSQDMCELEPDFLGFINVYQPLSHLIPKDKIVIDFGCYLAPQAYFFKDHEQYIGVDICRMDRFAPPNALHYRCSIQGFVEKEVPELFAKKGNRSYFAICSYVPDFDAVKLVRNIFENVCCYYPGRNT